MIKYPLLLKPAYKDYLWGGTKLKAVWGKADGPDKIAEAWELSLRIGSLSYIENGKYASYSLLGLLELAPDFAGLKCKAFDKFPMLIKFIDSKEKLSVQVHPGDAYASEHEKSYGKSEVWYILDAEQGAGIYLGFQNGLTEDEYRKHIAGNTLPEALNFIEVKPGDIFMIEAGTVHAIGAGMTVCEIQQNSDLTYRVYDYCRKDADGNTRELKIDKAVAVSNTAASRPVSTAYPFVEYGGYKKRLVADNKYFVAEHYVINSGCDLHNAECFTALTVIGGGFYITGNGITVSADKGRTVFLPAGLAVNIQGRGELLASSL